MVSQTDRQADRHTRRRHASKWECVGSKPHQVVGPSRIVTREDGVELNHTVIIRLLYATQGSPVQVRRVVGVPVALGLDARVDARGVAAPDVGPDAGEGLAGVDVDELDVRDQGHALLVLDQVRPDVLAQDVEGADLALRVEHRAVGAVEHDRLVRLGRRRVHVALVVRPEDADGAPPVEVVAHAVGRCSCLVSQFGST